MIDVNDLKEFLNYCSNKEQSGNTMTPDEYNRNLPIAQLAVML